MNKLTDASNQWRDTTADTPSRLLVGDFYQYSWQGKSDEMFQEWMCEGGMWELSDPALPSHVKGSALDKFIIWPGAHIPSELLPPESMEWLDSHLG